MRIFLLTVFLAAAIAGVSSHPFDNAGCTSTYEQMEGPYWLDSALVRSDIREGQAGVPLYLNLVLLNQSSTSVCQPLVGVAADIWHTNATGYYGRFTGYDPNKPAGAGPAKPTDDLTFFRGVQLTDKNGQANFTTIYPGWYYGRCIHIHLEVHLQGTIDSGKFVSGGSDAYTGQLFFDDSWTAKIAKLPPYSGHTQLTYTPNSKDGIYVNDHGSANLLTLVPVDPNNLALGFHSTFVVNVDASSLQQQRAILNRMNPDFRSYHYLY